MGAAITGAGTSTIEVEGVTELVAVESEIMGDRIEAGTFLMALGIAGGDITLEGIRIEHLEMVVLKLEEMGMRVSPTRRPVGPAVTAGSGPSTSQPCRSPASPPTTCPLVVALLATLRRHPRSSPRTCSTAGSASSTELNRMGADIRNEGRHAVIRGKGRLSGAPVRALDVRAGAAARARGARGRRRDHRPRAHHV